eukprot:TRINITY_DN13195_c0_g1_i1.p1 TRINITY_DN13195_c0_g1~~TRINITY_DN13195_c0_g1_i1.p1  ORF type:complete len:189 (+),score=44.09 TRINITY_DN13195_c0_g1_i1:128-694(+)
MTAALRLWCAVAVAVGLLQHGVAVRVDEDDDEPLEEAPAGSEIPASEMNMSSALVDKLKAAATKYEDLKANLSKSTHKDHEQDMTMAHALARISGLLPDGNASFAGNITKLAAETKAAAAEVERLKNELYHEREQRTADDETPDGYNPWRPINWDFGQHGRDPDMPKAIDSAEGKAIASWKSKDTIPA